jgi:hypothetical protein
MTVELTIHGERRPGQVDGPSRSFTVASRHDPNTAVATARRLLQSGAWRTVPKQGDDTDKAVYLLRVHAPAALAVLPRVAVAAMTKQLDQGGCAWCAVHVLAVLSFGAEQEPAHDDPVLLAFLGQPCGRCRSRHSIADQVRQVVEDAVDEARTEARLAAGTPRTTQVQDPPPAPPATPPPLVAVTPPPTPAPARASRVPDPHYFTRLPWPPEDTP